MPAPPKKIRPREGIINHHCPLIWPCLLWSYIFSGGTLKWKILTLSTLLGGHGSRPSSALGKIGDKDLHFNLKAASPLCLLESSWCFKESIHENFHQACCGTAQCSQRLAPPRHPKEFREGHLSKRPIALLIVTLPCIFCRFCRSCCSCCFSALEQGLIRRTWKWLKENPLIYIFKRFTYS